ncbi:hypothetical protein B0H14DRAFT_2664625 [Mycena olivaceomarginata]|nr:hypothetical protein B0H14DRAFT_2664625 [Mycena olivaceomarginata]
MSENEQRETHSRSHSPAGSIPLKRRRLVRSCDVCRERKVRCDGQNICSSCLAFGSPCTYMEPRRKRAWWTSSRGKTTTSNGKILP